MYKKLIDYVGKLSKNLKQPTVWSTYSVLHNTINIKLDVDISQFYLLYVALIFGIAGVCSSYEPHTKINNVRILK